MQQDQNHLKALLHPYVFILKEGGKIKKNLLDYSLMMLYVHSSETIRSPQPDSERILFDLPEEAHPTESAAHTIKRFSFTQKTAIGTNDTKDTKDNKDSN